jgi:hypothetical protein
VASGYQRQLKPVTGLNSSETGANASASPQAEALALTVLFTNVHETLAALHEAARFAHQLGARIRILAPLVVPYPLPLDKPRVDPQFRLRQFRTLCEQEPIETWIDAPLCRDALQVIQESLEPHSLVLIGGNEGWNPFGFRRRLVTDLRKAGHQPIFVGRTGRN